MPGQVKLIVTEGHLSGKVFAYDDRSTCIVGRAKGCEPRLGGDRTVSRHHCLLDINPPDIRIRDFGSLNGTQLNDQIIGCRKPGQSPEDARRLVLPEHDLRTGDIVKLGRTRLQVEVIAPIYCTSCSREIPEDRKDQCQRRPGVYLCGYCRTQLERSSQLQATEIVCSQCGRDISDEIGAGRRGMYVCATCQEHPLNIVNLLIKLAKSGEPELTPIEGYAIEKELGRGGMGAVFLARHQRTRKRRALKLMLPKVAADRHSTERFLRETKNTASLNHPNVVKLFDYGCSHGTFFFTLEYCRGGAVDRLVKHRGGTLPIDLAVEITRQMLEGLDYAHHADAEVVLKDGSIGRAKGLVHRDLSPHNLLLSGPPKSLNVKLADFGLSKAFDTAGLSGMTYSGKVGGKNITAGKPLFMPRQQVLNFKHCGPEVDVWAAAATLYFLLAGAPPRPFPKTKKKDIWQTILETSPVPIRNRNPSIPKKLAEAIDAALVEKPKIQFTEARQLKRALEEAV